MPRVWGWQYAAASRTVEIKLSNSPPRYSEFADSRSQPRPRDLAACFARGLILDVPPSRQRAQGMPDARCTRGRLCSKKAQASATRGTPHQPAFPAQWCYGLYALSPGTGLSCPRHSWFVSTNLTPASGRQDHAISPSAIASFVAQKLRPTPPRPSHPASNVRDDREAPLMWERDGENCKFDLG
jgi:hypothetical protein